MRKRENLLLTIVFFSVLSILFISLSKTIVTNGPRFLLEEISLPLQKVSYGLFHTFLGTSFAEEKKIEVVSQEVSQKTLEKENKALSDQFQTVYPKSKNLLPANIIGMPSFLPGITEPEVIILDRGEKENVRVGQAVVYKNNLIGKVAKITSHLALVDAMTKNSFSIPAKTLKTEAIGIISGRGKGEALLENVVLSDELRVSDIVVTSGSVELNGNGVLPNLVIGKITSVDKKPSSLFQTASVKSFLDFKRLTTVFIVM